jgi:hypothetical protein
MCAMNRDPTEVGPGSTCALGKKAMLPCALELGEGWAPRLPPCRTREEGGGVVERACRAAAEPGMAAPCAMLHWRRQQGRGAGRNEGVAGLPVVRGRRSRERGGHHGWAVEQREAPWLLA